MTDKEKQKSPLTTATIRSIAVSASVDPATVRKVLGGGIPRGLSGDRVRAELEKRGLAHLAQQLYVIERVGAPNTEEG